MLAHRASHAEAARFGRNHEASIRDMVPQPRPIRSQDVAAGYFPILLRCVSARALCEPIRLGLFARRIGIVNKDVPRRHGRLKDFPDGVAIGIDRLANVHGHYLDFGLQSEALSAGAINRQTATSPSL